GVIHDCEKIAAHAIHHRLDDAPHRIRRNRLISLIAALSQDRGAGLRPERTFRCHDTVARHHHRTCLRSILRPHCRKRHDHSHKQQKRSQPCAKESVQCFPVLLCLTSSAAIPAEPHHWHGNRRRTNHSARPYVPCSLSSSRDAAALRRRHLSESLPRHLQRISS